VCVRRGKIQASAYGFRSMYFFCSKPEYSVLPLNYETEVCMSIHLLSESRQVGYKHMVCMVKDKLSLRMNNLATVCNVSL
jgi:hypothetical protein